MEQDFDGAVFGPDSHDAIILLGNLIDSEGRINEETISRIRLACDLWNKRIAPLLVTSGWSPVSTITLAEAMKSYAVTHYNIPANAIIPEPSSRDTVGDALFTKRKLAKAQNWRSVIVVTSAYHAERSQQIFSFVYGYPVPVAPAPSAISAELAASETRSIEAFLKTFSGIKPGDDEAICKRLAQRHPFYNGEIYPAIEC